MKYACPRSLSVIFSLGLMLASQLVYSNTIFPTQPVHLINPFPPGAVSDQMLRAMAANLHARWGQPVIVESKPGGGTLIAANYIAKSKPDGYTIGLVLPAVAIGAAMRSSMPFDTIKDFAPVTELATIPLGLFANPSTPFNTVPELVAYAKANPGKLNFGSVGVGSGSQMAGELFKLFAGVDLVHVPYKGSKAAQLDLIAGRIDLFFDAIAVEDEYVKDGKVKLIGVASTKRLPGYEQYATIGESVPGYSVDSWFGLVVQADTPPPLIAILHKDMVQALRSPEVAQPLESLGLNLVGSTSDEFSQILKAEIEKWKELSKSTGIRLD